ncbi:hypothetical protein [Haladaptatus sp. CMAA 1911]|uniref:DUF7344 domain-containing protein n=1 Tax=unclassified Haladaptatus TaxID=2622732 RepID=UPI0037546554
MNQPEVAPPSRSELDVLLRAVNHPYRRHTLQYLVQVTEPQPVADIAAAVNERMDQQSPSDRQQLALALIHRHLPRLNDAELIEWTHRNLVAPTATTSDAVAVFETAAEYFE